MLKIKLEGDLIGLEEFLKLMSEKANYQPCVDKKASSLEQLLAIKPQKGKLMVYSSYDHKLEPIYAKLDENVFDFLKKHKHGTIVRIIGFSLRITYKCRKITIVRLSQTPEGFDCEETWNSSLSSIIWR